MDNIRKGDFSRLRIIILLLGFGGFFGLPAKSYIFKKFSYTLIVFDNKQLALVLT